MPPDSNTRPGRRLWPAGQWAQIHAAVQERTAHLSGTTRGLLWAAGSGLLFSFLNALMRLLALHLDPFQTQFLRYLFGLLVLLPLVWAHGLAAYRPQQMGGSLPGVLCIRWRYAYGFLPCRAFRWQT